MKRLYRATELAEILGVPVGTIYRWGREKKLKRVKVGRTVRFEMPQAE